MKLGIVIGVSKAGTTSVFEYLKAHPQCCGALVKQTNFFLDADMVNNGLVAARPFNDSTDCYAELFPDYRPDQVLVEASPDYILSPGTAPRLAAYCKRYNHEAYQILILRNPLTRLVSWFHFGRKQGSVPLDENLATFIEKSKQTFTLKPQNMPYLAMQTGLYMPLIQHVWAHHPPHRLLVLSYEDLVAHPEAAMVKISAFLGIDPGFYKGFHFEVYNKTTGVRSSGMARFRKQMRQAVLPVMHRFEIVKFILRPFVGLGKKVYDTANTTGVGHEKLSDVQTDALGQFYAADRHELEKALKQTFNW
jgi:hypothetical protein